MWCNSIVSGCGVGGQYLKDGEETFIWGTWDTFWCWPEWFRNYKSSYKPSPLCSSLNGRTYIIGRKTFSLVIHSPESSNCTCELLNPRFFSLGNKQQKAVGPQGAGIKAVKIMNICVVDLSAAGIEREAPEVNDLQVIKELSRTRSRSCWAWPCWPTAVSYS